MEKIKLLAALLHTFHASDVAYGVVLGRIKVCTDYYTSHMNVKQFPVI